MTKILAAPGAAVQGRSDPRRIDPRLSELIRRQHGVLSSGQGAAHGLPHETLRQRVLRGIWLRLLPGIYALQCGPPTALQRCVAALLYAGEGSMLTGLAALAEHRLPAPRAVAAAAAAGSPAGRLDVLVPQRVRRQNLGGVRIIRTNRLPVPIESGPLRFAPLARAVMDACLALAEAGEAAAAEALIATALADGRIGLAELEEELSLAPRRHSGALRTHLAELRASARERASNRLAEALDGDALTGPVREVVIYQGRRRIAQATALWPARAVVAAVDPPEQEVSVLSEFGLAVVRITPHQVTQDLPEVLRRIREVLVARPEATLPADISFLSSAHPAQAAQAVTSVTAAPPTASPTATATGMGADTAPVAADVATTSRPGPLPRTATSRQFTTPTWSAPTVRGVVSTRRQVPTASPPDARKTSRVGAGPQRVLTASSPARTGTSSVLPRGGTGQT